MISSSLALILLLVGGQTAVFVPDPPGGPGKEYMFPIGDDEPGGGGGGKKYSCDPVLELTNPNGSKYWEVWYKNQETVD